MSEAMATMKRTDSIQTLAGLPLKKKAAEIRANAQTNDQIMSDIPWLLELGFIVGIVAQFCRPSPVESK